MAREEQILVGDDEIDIDFNAKWRDREYELPAISLENAQLWSPDTPYLYTAEVTLYDNEGNIADQIKEPFGVRTIEIVPQKGLLVNGKKVLLKGYANHHTLGALGAAAYPRAIEKRLKLMKEFGMNHIRTSHNPYSEDFLKLCDKYGILVVDELYDKWLTQYAGGRVDGEGRTDSCR
jgi:beta-galactosidase